MNYWEVDHAKKTACIVEGLEPMREMSTLMGGRCVMIAGMTPTQQWFSGQV